MEQASAGRTLPLRAGVGNLRTADLRQPGIILRIGPQ